MCDLSEWKCSKLQKALWLSVWCFVCEMLKAAKNIVIWVFGVLFVKCSKLQKKKNIVIECFVFCLWKCSKLQKKKKHCDWWLSVLCFVCENAESCKTIFRLWIEEISTYSFGGDEEEELMKIFLYPLLQWMKRNTEKKGELKLLLCTISSDLPYSDNKFQ